MKLDAELLGAGGRVVVRADPNCTQARITIRTADETGPAADAVRDARLESSPDGRVTASAQQTQPGLSIGQGAGNIVGDGYVVHNGNVVSNYYSNDGSGISVISHSGSGSIISGGGRIGNLSFGDGTVFIDGVDGGAFTVMQGTSPIEIEAIVPEGSSVECSTDSASLETHGKVDVVEADTASGNVSVEQASEVRAGTASGNVNVQQATDVQARTASGNVNVDKATDVRATTASGNVRVDRADHVAANTASGDVRVQSAVDIRATTASGDVNVHLGETVRATTASGDVSVGYAEDLQTRTASGDVSVRNADKVVARSDSGAIDIGTTKDATARSRRGNISVRDAQGTVQAHSGTGSVQVRATGGGSVTAGSATGSVDVTASDRAISEGLTVKAEGPPGRVSTPEGANTGTGTAAGSNGARDFNSTSRADRARDTGTARD